MHLLVCIPHRSQKSIPRQQKSLNIFQFQNLIIAVALLREDTTHLGRHASAHSGRQAFRQAHSRKAGTQTGRHVGHTRIRQHPYRTGRHICVLSACRRLVVLSTAGRDRCTCKLPRKAGPVAHASLGELLAVAGELLLAKGVAGWPGVHGWMVCKCSMSAGHERLCTLPPCLMAA